MSGTYAAINGRLPPTPDGSDTDENDEVGLIPPAASSSSTKNPYCSDSVQDMLGGMAMAAGSNTAGGTLIGAVGGWCCGPSPCNPAVVLKAMGWGAAGGAGITALGFLGYGLFKGYQRCNAPASEEPTPQQDVAMQPLQSQQPPATAVPFRPN